MFYNHARKPVWDWPRDQKSLCPECHHELVPRRGEIVAWHWAHKPTAGSRVNCPHEESAWHLAMKQAYIGFKDWEIEVPLVVNGKIYRIDAMNQRTGNIREFVHSLSPHYQAKHESLAYSVYSPLWIFDGEEFGSLRATPFKGNGMRDLLKPRAYDLQEHVGGLVHYDGQLFGEWKNNIWFPRTGAAAAAVLQRIAVAQTQTEIEE